MKNNTSGSEQHTYFDQYAFGLELNTLG